MEAGKTRLAGDTARVANTDEVRDLRLEARDLKEVCCLSDMPFDPWLLVCQDREARDNFFSQHAHRRLQAK
jgi:hypothetical protein